MQSELSRPRKNGAVAPTLSSAYRLEVYVPVRRMTNFLKVSIYSGIQWAVFEPNDEPLWASLRLNIGAFMTDSFRQGAFQGIIPSEVFFVKCDKETNPQINIDNRNSYSTSWICSIKSQLNMSSEN